MAEAHVKAVPVNGLYDFVSSRLSSSELQAAIESLPENERNWFTGHLLAHQQVPLSSVNRFCVAAARERGEDLESFARQAGEHGAKQGLKTVYKFVMMVMSPEAVLRKAPLMWSRVYDCGTMKVDSAENSAMIHVTDFPSEPAGCARATGWFTVIGERAGAKNVQVTHTLCMARGNEECRWDFAWE